MKNSEIVNRLVKKSQDGILETTSIARFKFTGIIEVIASSPSQDISELKQEADEALGELEDIAIEQYGTRVSFAGAIPEGMEEI